MSEQSWSNSISSTTWWSTSAYKHGVFDLFENKLFGVIETSGIDGLSEELAWWLRSISVKLRHVHIVDEEDHFLTTWWSKKRFSLGFKVTLEGILEILGGCFSREVNTS